ncbi:hypothetical protein VM98_33915 [Streptomyces rubellomurinus subsp. indigoferus]|nr:hypothetical protein VM98_33915 [Streptomyces rubellomurinus subsp. indigoferus]
MTPTAVGRASRVVRRGGGRVRGRMGQSGGVAGAVHFLARAEAGFITGEILHCNGGEPLGR